MAEMFSGFKYLGSRASGEAPNFSLDAIAESAVVCIGDSLTEFTTRMYPHFLHSQIPGGVTALGIPGFSTEQMRGTLSKAYQELSGLRCGMSFPYALVCLGTNDLGMDQALSVPYETTEQALLSNMKHIVADLAFTGTVPIVVGLPGAPNCDNDAIQKLNSALRATFPFYIDTFNTVSHFSDGLHPTEEGAQQMAEAVLPALRTYLEKPHDLAFSQFVSSLLHYDPKAVGSFIQAMVRKGDDHTKVPLLCFGDTLVYHPSSMTGFLKLPNVFEGGFLFSADRLSARGAAEIVEQVYEGALQHRDGNPFKNVLISLGLTDLARALIAGTPIETAAAEYGSNMERIAKAFTDRQIAPLIVGIPNLDPQVHRMISGADPRKLEELVIAFNTAAREIAPGIRDSAGTFFPYFVETHEQDTSLHGIDTRPPDMKIADRVSASVVRTMRELKARTRSENAPRELPPRLAKLLGGIRELQQPEQGPYMPPSENMEGSFPIRVTRGCHWNRCSFCTMYLTIEDSVRDVDDIKRDIDYYATLAKTGLLREGGPVRLFLQDGDVMNVPTDTLLAVLDHASNRFEEIERVTAYGIAFTVLRKSPDELRRLREAGLSRVHIGLESGHPDVLSRTINKGATVDMMVEAGQRIMDAGMALSEYVITGMGGRALSDEHADASGEVLTRINPDIIGIRTLKFSRNTPLLAQVRDGSFVPLTDVEAVSEQLRMLRAVGNVDSFYAHNHDSNLIQAEGQLPADREQMERDLSDFIGLPPHEQKVLIAQTRLRQLLFQQHGAKLAYPDLYPRIADEIEGFSGLEGFRMAQTMDHDEIERFFFERLLQVLN